MSRPAMELDFVRRLADAWDGRGNDVLTGGECRALWSLAYLQPYGERQPRWNDIPADQRRRLFTAARAAIELGRLCSRVLPQ